MYFGVPALWASLSTADLQAMRPARLLVSGAGGLPGRLFDRVEQVCGQRLLNRYAMTETLIITSPRLGDARSPRSVGPPLPGVEVRLSGTDGPPGPDGSPVRDVEIRSPGLFSGYLGRDPVLDPDGWFRTGDLGAWAEDGSLRILGRRDTDLIKTGGYRVGAGEVEDAVLAHPGVAEVAVAGVPDHKLGQRVVAWVVPASSLDQAEMQSFLAARLAPYKRPLEIHLVDSLPRNALGKVQKRQLHHPIAVSDAREGR
jgi:acyl-CoA synthetase (AMP-forming)/AMP-acid ligase II